MGTSLQLQAVGGTGVVDRNDDSSAPPAGGGGQDKVIISGVEKTFARRRTARFHGTWLHAADARVTRLSRLSASSSM